MLWKETIWTGKNCERITLPHLHLPRTECLKPLFCHFCLQTLLLLLKCAQPWMTVVVLILCTSERGHSVLDTHLFKCTVLIFIELLELEVVFRNFFCWVYNRVTRNILDYIQSRYKIIDVLVNIQNMFILKEMWVIYKVWVHLYSS